MGKFRAASSAVLGQQILSCAPVTSRVRALHVLEPLADGVIERSTDRLHESRLPPAIDESRLVIPEHLAVNRRGL